MAWAAIAILAASLAVFSADAQGIYGKTVFYGDVSLGTLPAPAAVAIRATAGGIWTNAVVYTNTYRLSGTNQAGRIPATTNLAASWTGSAATGAVYLAWREVPGVNRVVVEQSWDDGATWTNWLTLSPGTTNWTDAGTSTWTKTEFSAAYGAVPAPTGLIAVATNVAWGNVTGEIAAQPDVVALAQTSGTAQVQGWGDVPTNSVLYANTVTVDAVEVTGSGLAPAAAGFYFDAGTNAHGTNAYLRSDRAFWIWCSGGTRWYVSPALDSVAPLAWESANATLYAGGYLPYDVTCTGTVTVALKSIISAGRVVATQGLFEAWIKARATDAYTLGGMTAGQFVRTNSATYWGGVESNFWYSGQAKVDILASGAISNATYRNCIFVYDETSNSVSSVTNVFRYTALDGTTYDRIGLVRAKGSFTAPNDTSVLPADGPANGWLNWQTLAGGAVPIHWWAIEADTYSPIAGTASAMADRIVTNAASQVVHDASPIVRVSSVTASRSVAWSARMAGVTSVQNLIDVLGMVYSGGANGTATKISSINDASGSNVLEMYVWRDWANLATWIIGVRAAGSSGTTYLNGRIELWPNAPDATATLYWGAP